MSQQAYPLAWPMGRPRWTRQRVPSLFKMTDGQMKDHLYDELDRLGATDVVVSTNRSGYSRSKAQPEDPGVAVYFKRKDREIAICCDKYKRIEENLHAIGIAVESFRTLERHGTGDMVDAAFKGFTALPESIVSPPPDRQKRPWWVVLGVDQYADVLTVKQAYRRAQATAHPDAGGSSYDFQEVQAAYEEWRSA